MLKFFFSVKGYISDTIVFNTLGYSCSGLYPDDVCKIPNKIASPLLFPCNPVDFSNLLG